VASQHRLAVAALAILGRASGDLYDPGSTLVRRHRWDRAGRCRAAAWPRAGVSAAASSRPADRPVALNQLSTIGLLANLGVGHWPASHVLGLVAIAAGFASEVLAGWLFSAAWPILIACAAWVRWPR